MTRPIFIFMALVAPWLAWSFIAMDFTHAFSSVETRAWWLLLTTCSTFAAWGVFQK